MSVHKEMQKRLTNLPGDYSIQVLLDVMAKWLDGGRGEVRPPQAGAEILLFPFVLEFNGLTVINRTFGLHFYIKLWGSCVHHLLLPSKNWSTI